MQSASELKPVPSERWAGACQPPFRHGAAESGKRAPPCAAYDVHSSSPANVAPVDVTSVCQPSFWHFFALAELPPPASAVPLAANSSAALTAANVQRRSSVFERVIAPPLSRRPRKMPQPGDSRPRPAALQAAQQQPAGDAASTSGS